MTNSKRIEESPQDKGREEFTRRICGLHETGEGRGGADAKDSKGNKFELKSSFSKNKSTASVRSLGVDHINKFRIRHWIFAFGTNFKDGSFELNTLYYVHPTNMEPWILKLEDQLITRKRLSARVLTKEASFLSPTELKLLETIHRWGCKLNVPMIPYDFVQRQGIHLSLPYNLHLQEIMQDVYPSSPLPLRDGVLHKGLEYFYEN
jgi:hypothetical protein